MYGRLRIDEQKAAGLVHVTRLDTRRYGLGIQCTDKWSEASGSVPRFHVVTCIIHRGEASTTCLRICGSPSRMIIGWG
jgi:hypothetical protein